MEGAARFFRHGVEGVFALTPLALALYLNRVQQPPLLLHDHLLHELAILVACALGAFVSLIALRCYQTTGEFFARHLVIGLSGFTVLYGAHGLLTTAAEHQFWTFILFGPVARLVLTAYLCVGTCGFDRPNTAPHERFALRLWLPHGMVIVGLIPATLLLAESPIAGAFATRALLEGTSITLCLAASLRLLTRTEPFGMKRYVVGGLLLTAQSSAMFLMTSAWTHVWWGAHLLAAAGFLILSYGVARAGTAGWSLEHLFSEPEMKRRLAEAAEVERTLRIAKDEAEAASRSKSEFLASMSHELRTPLNAVIGFSEMMRDEVHGPLDNRHYREYAQLIHDSGNHLLALINDVLDVSRIEVGALTLDTEPVDLAAIVRAAEVMVRKRAARGGITVVLDLPPDLPAIEADPRRVKQVLLNLLANAVKFTDAGGTVGVRAWTEATGTLVVTVTDDGIGMRPEDIPTALSVFGQVDSRLERRFEGSGLGLPLARSMMELHGGSLDIVSALGHGTAVTLKFPPERVLQSA